jgi:hypothetical protein
MSLLKPAYPTRPEGNPRRNAVADLVLVGIGVLVLVAVGTRLGRSRGFSRRDAGSTQPNQIRHIGTGPPHRPA